MIGLLGLFIDFESIKWYSHKDLLSERFKIIDVFINPKGRREGSMLSHLPRIVVKLNK